MNRVFVLTVVLVVALALAVALARIVGERARPGRAFHIVRGWWARAFLLNGVQVAIVIVAGRAWDGWMVAHRPWSSDALGPVWALLAYLAITFVYSFWHRARRASPILWRLFHQVHHGQSRIELVTSCSRTSAPICLTA